MRKDKEQEPWFGNAVKGGSADFLNRNANVLDMNSLELEHARRNTAIEDIWDNNNLTVTEKAALYRAAQGNPEKIKDMLSDRVDLSAALRSVAEDIDPGEYSIPDSFGGRLAHDVVRAAPYTVASLAQNAPLSILGGPIGGVIGGVIGASNEAQMERAEVYNELRKLGMSHEEAYEQSEPLNWQNMATLSASNIAQNLLTFAGNKIMPGAGPAMRTVGAIAGDVFSEGAEEGLQKIYTNRALKKENDWKEIGYDALVGGISGGLFGAGGTAVNSMFNSFFNSDPKAPDAPHSDWSATDYEARFRETVDYVNETRRQRGEAPLSDAEVQQARQMVEQEIQRQSEPEAYRAPEGDFVDTTASEARTVTPPVRGDNEARAQAEQLALQMGQQEGAAQAMQEEAARAAQAQEQEARAASAIENLNYLRDIQEWAGKMAGTSESGNAIDPAGIMPSPGTKADRVAAPTTIADSFAATPVANAPVVPTSANTVVDSEPGEQTPVARTVVSEPIVQDSTDDRNDRIAELEDLLQSIPEGAAEPVRRAAQAELDRLRGVNEAPKPEATPAPQPAPSGDRSPSRVAADAVAERLKNGEKIRNNRALFDITDEAFGGTQGEGKYSVKDAYDAMELGVNLYVREKGLNPSAADKSAAQAAKDIESINSEILDNLPTQANRTAEQDEFQQFSTPPNLAYAANWLLRAGQDDVVLEPSAGIGGLAVYAQNAGARVVGNELSGRRAQVLREMGLDNVYEENAEQIHNVLPDTVKPTRVVMNPPFSSTAGRIQGQRDTKNATKHVEQALKRLEPGGRAVVILGKGMADTAPAFKSWWKKVKQEYNVRANVELSGKDFRKYGTTFGNALVVIDKTGPTPAGSTVTGKFDSVVDALPALEGVRNDVQLAASASDSQGATWLDRVKDKADAKRAEMVDNKEGSDLRKTLDALKERRADNERMTQARGVAPIADARLDESIRKLEREIAQDEENEKLRTLSPEANAKRGSAAMERVIKDHVNIRNAMYRDDVGGISFVWGQAKKSVEDGKKVGAHGIAHIIDKHGEGAARKMVDVLAKGKIEKRYAENAPLQERVDIVHDGHLAHLALYKDGNRETWLLTGYEMNGKKEKPSGEIEPVYDGDDSTLSEPTHSRPGKGAEGETSTSFGVVPGNRKSKPRGSKDNIPSSEKTVKVNPVENPVPSPEAEPKVGDIPTKTEELSGASLYAEPGSNTIQNADAIEVTQKTEAERHAERAAKVDPETDSAVYDDYTPAKLKIKGAKPHPADLVQSAAMAAVEPPDPTYKPKLPKTMIESGALSEAQLETVVYAGQSFEKTNLDGTRRGYFIGDGTGVGKGREISGILTDQLAQGRGKGKAVWISEKNSLVADARRDWEGIGNNPEDIFEQKSVKVGDGVDRKKGILFSAYTTIRSKERLEQLKRWLGKDFDGVIALDEAHNANNAMEQKGARGKVSASQQAIAVQELVKAFPDARVLYVSATGATEVRNLAMLDRLGLWGEGTQFATKSDFIAEIEKGGTAAMELVARDMKALGLYTARSISYRAGKHGGPEDVTFRRLEHPLTEHQRAVYDRIADAWQVVLNNIDRALEVITGEENASKVKGGVRSRKMSAFWGAHQRCFNQIITSMQTPAVVNAIHNDLKEGKSVVIQLTNTNEADTKRAVEGLGEGETLDDLDVTPKDALLNFLRSSFPVEQLQQVADEDGKNIRYEVAKDSKGNTILNREAVAMRDELIADIASISFPNTPLDMLLDEFGADQVAEITGRSKRYVMKGGTRTEESRTPTARKADSEAFQRGDKRILVFSEAGGTGASYHADKAAENQQKRVHYLLQPGWRADKAIQGLGRTHRSNEAHKPEYVLVTTDLPGQRRFISTIARRLEQLGALTTGERKSATQGLFSERDNLESKHAQSALNSTMDMIVSYGVGDISPNEVLEKLGFQSVVNRDTGALDLAKLPPVPQFLNRILSLQYGAQQSVFGLFEQQLDREIKKAIDDGSLDTGMETLRADEIEVVQESTVYKDDASGVESKYVMLETRHRQKPVPFASVSDADFYISKKTGNIVAARKAPSRTNNKTGEIIERARLSAVDPIYRLETSKTALENEQFYSPVSKGDAKRIWKEQSAALPEFRTEKRHLITGAILPIWKKIEGHQRVVRVSTKSGQTFLGRLIPAEGLMGTLRRLETEYKGGNYSPEDVMKAVAEKGSTVVLTNGWKLKLSRVNGESRVELTGSDFTVRDRLRNYGLIHERISWKDRWFVPTGNDTVMTKLLNFSPALEIRAGDIMADAADIVNEGIEDFDINDYGGLTIKILGGGIGATEAEAANIASESASFGVDDRVAGNVPGVEATEGGSTPFEFRDPETEKRYQAARKGVQRTSAIQNLGESLRGILRGLKSDFPGIAGQQFSLAREELRKLNRKRGVAAHDSLSSLRASVKNMTPNEFDLFNRKRILDDLKYQKEEMPGSALPYGFTDAQLDAEHTAVSELVEKSDKVQRAIRFEEQAIKTINENMVAEAKRLGWNSLEKKFSNPHYFRHVVLEYANAASQGRKAGLYAPESRGYLKRRRGSEKDISANYIQAMGEVRALQLQDTETLKTLHALRKEYDISEDLKKEAFRMNNENFLRTLAEMARGEGLRGLEAALWIKKRLGDLNKNQANAINQLFEMAQRGVLPEGKFGNLVDAMSEAKTLEDLTDGQRKELNRYMSWLAGLKDEPGVMESRVYFKYVAKKKKEIKETLGDGFVDWRDLLPEGYTEWNPFQHRIVFSVNTVAETLVNQALDQGLDELNIPVDALQKMRVMGGYRQTWAIPAELADTLSRLNAPVERTQLGNAAKIITTQWKEWVLHSPMRLFRYNFRNVTGDIDPVLAANPDALRHVPQAIQELANVYVKGKVATDELAEFTRRGGAMGAMHIQEIGDHSDMRQFVQILEQGEKGMLKMPKKFWRGYWEFARNVSDFRENVLRYATYLSYLKQMEGSETQTPKNWGASDRSEVMANADVRDRAYKLSNELLGAYDQVSETGKWLRDIAIPFWSWVEVNFRRYGNIFRNGMQDGNIGDVTKRTLLGHAARSPMYAWRFGALALKISLFTLLLQAFNNIVMGDDEKDLTPDVRGRPHITLGRDSLGRVVYFDRVGAFADVLDWFALDTAPQDIKDILDGRMSLGEQAERMAKAPVSKLLNAMTPLAKVPIEATMRKQMFPDAFNPRTIKDMGVYFAETMGLTPEFVAVTGRPSPGYLKSRVQSTFMYTKDPEESAYWWIMDRRRQFEERVLGQTFSGGNVSERGDALRNLKASIRYGDRPAALKYLKKYASYGGSEKGLKRSLDGMNPFGGLSSAEQAQFLHWLSPDDRRYLKNAVKYYGKIRSIM